MGVAIIALALLALIPGFIAKQKGRSFLGFFFLSFLTSPLISIIIALCVSNQAYVYCPKESIIVDEKTDHKDEPQQLYSSENISGWRCSCGRVRAKYESSCICGKSKFDVMNSTKTEASSETTATGSQILFCRKCGEKLLPDSQFCGRCGTKL